MQNKTTVRPSRDCCKFCHEPVDLNNEGNTYKDGTCAHEGCPDAEEFRRENAPDLDRE